MGGCLGLQNRYVLIDYHRINIDILINKWKDEEMQIIKNKIKQFQKKSKTKKISFQLFLQFFPLLKEYYTQNTHKKIFNLFDYNRDQLLYSRQIIFGLSLIVNSEVKQLVEILYKMYKKPHNPTMNKLQLEQFIKENKNFIKQSEKIDLNQIKNEPIVPLTSFYNLLQECFDIKKFRNIFQFATNQKQIHLIEEIKNNNYKILIEPNQRVYLISFKWFYQWKKYVQLRYQLETQIQFLTQIKKPSKIRKIQSNTQSLVKSFYQQQHASRPKRIQNRFMQGQYKNQLKQKLQNHKDFIAISQNMWNILHQLYGGGPEFPRIYPQFHPLQINRVYVNAKGKFIEQKLQRFTVLYKDKMSVIFTQNVQGNIFYKKNLEEQNWKKIIIQNNNISDCEILNQCFVCAMDPQAEQNFKNQYNLNSENKYKNIKNYGIKFKVKIYLNFSEAYLMQLGNDKIKIHFKGKPYESDKYITHSQFQKIFDETAIPDPTKSNICAGLYNLGNTCYINSVLQCLYYTPIFGQILIQQRYKQQLNQEKSKGLMKQFSKLTMEMSGCTQSIRPFDLRKSITKHISRFANNQQQDAQQFLCQFLNKLSEQLSKNKVNIAKLSKLDFEVEEQQKIQKYSLIQKIFSGTECSRIICTKCKNVIQKRQNFFALSIPVPQIQYGFYHAMYVPSNIKKDKQFPYMRKCGIKVKKTANFEDYALEFSKILKKPLQNLFFLELGYYETDFRRLIKQDEYKNPLNQVGIRITDQIYFFDKLSQIDIKPKQPSKIKNTKNIQKDTIIDINYFNQYKPARFLQYINESTNQFKFQFQGDIHSASIQEIYPFLYKCRQNKGFLIQVKHRRRSGKYKNEYFGIPNVIYIYEWMTWKQIKQLVDNTLMQRYLDPDYERKIKQEQMDKQKQKKQQAQREKQSKTKSDQKTNQKLLKQSGVELKLMSDYKIKMPLYNITLVQNYNSRCWHCNKIIMIQQQIDKQQKQQQYICKGCKIDQQIPLSIQVAFKRIAINIDWIQARAYQKQTFKFIQDQSFKQRQKQQDQIQNSIRQCFKLYSSQQQQVQLKCQKCNNQYSLMRTLVSKPPNILIIHFKRFKFIKGYLEKMNNKISIPLDINLKQISMAGTEDTKFELYAINCHRGSGFGGHYLSYVLKDQKTWVKCDDEFTEATQLQNINLGEIYLLFFRKKKMEASLLSFVI